MCAAAAIGRRVFRDAPQVRRNVRRAKPRFVRSCWKLHAVRDRSREEELPSDLICGHHFDGGGDGEGDEEVVEEEEEEVEEGEYREFKFALKTSAKIVLTVRIFFL